ncbi:hypothetical protein SARC_10451 [Sphaeroforma arctica JP610]|uniref:Uncharacterized protein n=1 Tax=Sphaeroforma arctica JP610 TaxID=667725 RepID=A0A0L0FM45_9EUKA|nr:hypothetical protein SARC_10451 [Sphaeroforma arctica JP610]KNC77078.1 hypothetical protein SARC_10451 [Sphaeroforma arctica JP610]|eukprot:XP_014150980.1 hypothetical protein SARC_10451 [Sphaeroforma arctica JP610]
MSNQRAGADAHDRTAHLNGVLQNNSQVTGNERPIRTHAQTTTTTQHTQYAQTRTIQYANKTQGNAKERNAKERNAKERNAKERNATQRNATQGNAKERNAKERQAILRRSNQLSSTGQCARSRDLGPLSGTGTPLNTPAGVK